MYREFFLAYIALIALLSSTTVSANAASTMWIKTYHLNDHQLTQGRCVIETSDGGFALAGYAYLGGKDDAWLVKTDAAGNEQWKQMYGGDEWDEVYSVVQTSDGGYALAGFTYSSSSVPEFWLVKTDASGVAQWNQTYYLSKDDRGYSMVQTSDEGFAIAGSGFYSTNPGSRDFCLVKTDSAGNEQWNQNYGGVEWDEAYSVVQTSDGGYAMAGYTQSFGVGGRDFWLVKTDASGMMQWNQTYGTTDPDTAHSVVETSDGGYAIVGDAGNSPDCDVLFVKMDASGNMLWNQTYGGTENDHGWSVVETTDGGFAIVGSTQSFGSGWTNVWLIKTDSVGAVQWNQTFGGTVDEWDMDSGYSVVETSDGGYAIAGRHTSMLNTYTDDLLLIKTNEYGVIPEFSSWVIPTLLLAASTLILVKIRKLLNKHSQESKI